MRTVFGRQKYLVSILMTALIILMTHITSFDAAPAAGGICQVGDVIAPGESCTYPDTNTKFSVNANGTGQFLLLNVGSNLNLEDITINGVSYTLVAKKLASGSWEIEKIGTAPVTTNTAPVFTDGVSTTRSVAENTAASTNIGTAVAATDADNDTLTYTLGGTDAASFNIISTTGQLQTKAALDYETKSSYTVTITVSDGNGGSDSITVTINVTDVNETVIISPRFVPLADRTSEVRDAIVEAVPNVTDAAKVTKAQVAAITNLNLRNAGITALKSGDFSGMTGLTSINLYNNRLSSLPNGIFEGLTSLTTVRLGRNAIDPLPFVVSLEKVANGQFKAVAPAGALFNIVLNITVTNGSITGGATTVTIPQGSRVSNTLTVTRTAGTTAHVTVDIEAFPSLPRNHYGYALVKSGNLPLVLISGTNTAPVFTDGVSTTRSVPENTAASTNIGTAVAATDADNNTLTYTLSGIDAASFRIISTSGQLQTKAALDYETKTSYSVTVSVSDGNGGTDSITVTINVTDVNETPTNTAPVFTDGASTTRSVPENTAASTNIGTAVAATDADNNTLTYTLSGIDAASFRIISTSGQLQTKAALDYETKTSYSVTVSVSDSNGGTDSITVTINVTDVNETPTNTAPVFTEGSPATRSVTENIEAGQHIGPAVAATDADGDTLAYTLGGTDAASFGIDSTTGQLKTKSPLDYETKRAYTVIVTVSDGTLTDTITVTINVTDIDESLNRPNESSYDHIEGPWLWMIAPGGNIITDNLSKASDGVITEAQIAQNGVNEGDHFNDLQWTSGRLLPTTVCGIFLCSSDNVINVVRKIGLTNSFQLNQYSAYALINIYSPRDQNNVLMGVGSDDSIKVWLNSSVVYINNTTRRTTGIQNRFHVNLNAGDNLLLVKVCNSGSWIGNDDWGMFFKIYLDTQDYTISLPIGNAVGQQSQTNTAPVFTDGVSTTRSIAENTASGQNIGTVIAATDADNDTLTYTLGGTDAASFSIVSTTGQLQTKTSLDYETKNTYSVTISVSDGNGGTDSITVTVNVTDVNESSVSKATSTAICKVGDVLKPGQSCTYPDTDAVFSVLANGKSQWNIPNLPSWLQWINQTSVGNSMSVSTTINGVSYHFKAKAVTNNSWEIEEIGDDRSQQPVTPNPGNTGNTPTLTTSTAAPLTEATLHGGVVSLNLSGGTFEQSTFRIRNAITVSGITGLTVDTFGVDRMSDTKATVELEFDGNMTTDGTFTISVGAGAIKDYDGAALTSQISVSSVTESITATTTASLTEATLDESEVTITLSGRKFERSSFDIRDAFSVSGITGVTIPWHDPDKDSDTQLSLELEFDGDMTQNGTLTFTVGADAIAGYNGPDLTAQINVTATGGTPTPTPTNSAPVFTDGTSTTRSVPENTASGTNIGNAVAATDADTGDTLTYSLGGTDASSFSIVNTSGQLQTSAALDYETKSSYAVTVSVSDGNGGSDSITVTINVTDVNENVANNAPVFTDGTSTTRSVAENTASGTNIGSAVSATDADNHTLTYTLGGTDASSFSIVSTSGQLQTSAALDYETKSSYSVTISVSDGNGGSDSISVTINVTDVNENVANNAPVFTDGTSTTRSVAENTASGTNIGSAVSATDADSHTLTYTLGGTDASSFSIVSTSGQLQTSATLDYETKSSYSVTISVSDGNGGSDSISVTINVTDVNETSTLTLSASTSSTLTEATLHGAVVSLNLSGGTFERAFWDLDDEISVSGITGVTYDDFFDVDRISDTKVDIELSFGGNMTANGTLTFTVESGAIVDYDGTDLTAQISVSAVTESITATTTTALTEGNIDGSEVTITLSGRKFERSSFDIRDAFSVSGITGVTIPWHDPDKDSDTELSLELEFSGDMTQNGTLTFTVGEDAIAGYSGPSLTAQLNVTAAGTIGLFANFPNPFNPETWIPYQLAKPSEVTITIYNIKGVVVRQLRLGHQAAGIYRSRSRAAYWDGKNEIGESVASGVYFYTLTAGDFTATRKMLIRK